MLSTELRIYSWDFLPYEAIAIILCYVYANAKALNAEQITRVRQWFWRAAFNERYRGASEHFVSRDLEAIQIFVVESKGKPDDFGRKPDKAIWDSVVFRSNNSRSRAFILALAWRRPRNLTNGVAIDTANALSIYNQKEFHHVYPGCTLKRSLLQGITTRLQTTACLASENKEISDSKPNEYLPACIERLGTEAEPTFTSNLLPAPDAFNYERATYLEFIEARTALIDATVWRLCDGKSR